MKFLSVCVARVLDSQTATLILKGRWPVGKGIIAFTKGL